MVSVYWREKAGSPFCKKAEIQTKGEYWLRYNQNRKQKWQRVGGWDRVAKAKLHRERELQRQEIAKQWGLQAPSTETSLSVPDAVERFLARKKLADKRPATIDSYQTTLNYFKDWCPRLYIEQLTTDDLLQFAAWRKREGDGERTVYNHFLTIMTFMKFCGRPRLVPKSDWPKYAERLVESYTEAEIESFRKHAKDEKERLVIEIFIQSGFRHGEVSHLEVTDIDWAGNKLEVKPKKNWDWKPKTCECRKVRVPSSLMLSLRHWCDGRAGLLFANTDRTPDKHLDRIVRDVAKRAGITGRVDCHKFRSTFATRKSAEFKPQDIQRMLGHKSLLTTMRYLAATDQDDPAFVAKIEGAA